MSSRVMDASGALAPGQAIRLHSADRAVQAEGKIQAIASECMEIEMALTDREYCDAPQQKQTLFASASGEDCVYRFLTQFRALTALPQKIWYVDAPEKVQRQQKRQFVRVPILGNLPFRVKFAPLYGGRWESSSVTLFDLSGSGVCIVARNEIPQGSQITLRVEELPGFGSLETEAQVRRCTKVRVLDHVVYHIGAHMADYMREGERDRLVQSLFRMQQAYLKKGVGV